MQTKTNVKAGAASPSFFKTCAAGSHNHNQTSAALKVRSNIKAGPGNCGVGLVCQHNQTSTALKVRSSVKAGGIAMNHNQATAGLKVKSSVKASGPGLVIQHNQTSAALKVQTNVKAGPSTQSKRTLILKST